MYCERPFFHENFLKKSAQKIGQKNGPKNGPKNGKNFVKIFLKISLENFLKKFLLQNRENFSYHRDDVHDDDDEVIVSVFTNVDVNECVHREQAHTHERVAERQLVVAKTNPPTERCTRCSLTIECSRGELIDAHSGWLKQQLIYFYLSLNCCFSLRKLVPVSGVSPDARGWSLYLTQLGGFVSRQRQFLWNFKEIGYI